MLFQCPTKDCTKRFWLKPKQPCAVCQFKQKIENRRSNTSAGRHSHHQPPIMPVHDTSSQWPTAHHHSPIPHHLHESPRKEEDNSENYQRSSSLSETSSHSYSSPSNTSNDNYSHSSHSNDSYSGGSSDSGYSGGNDSSGFSSEY